MPTLVDLFKTKTITEGPDAGKTVQQAVAVRNSKDVEIKTTNPLLQKFTDKINRRRKEQSRIIGETRLEQETVGLKALSDTTKSILYGGDYFRIINKTTRSKQVMLKNANSAGAGLDDSLTDKIGSAIGNFVGDRISNGLQKKEDRVDPPPKFDARALAIDVGADIASRTLGRLFPDPMIPSKVVQEFEKGRQKNKENFIHEYDLDKRIITLKNKKGIPKLIEGLLKEGKDSLGQNKDFLISKAGTIASGLLQTGIGKLSDLIFDSKKKTKMGNQKTTIASNFKSFKWSSTTPYSKTKMATVYEPNILDRGDLSSNLIIAKAALVAFIKKIPIDNVLKDKKVIDVLIQPKTKYTENTDIKTIHKFPNKGIADTGDLINAFPNGSYGGRVQTVGDSVKKTTDAWDFIALKFYSIDKQKTIQFRCSISELTETFSPSWESTKFIGNPFPFYTYSGIERTLNFSFKAFSMNLEEHKYNWQRLNELAGLTYPQSFAGMLGAATPPIIEFTLGDMYQQKHCFIDSMTYSVDENTPWEIGMNKKMDGPMSPSVPTGFVIPIKTDIASDGYKLPMWVNVEMSIKFLESRGNTLPNKNLYDYK